MSKFLITGGLQRPNAKKLGEGRRYHCGKLLLADFERKTVDSILSFDKPNEAYPEDTPNILFTAASLVDGVLYLCSETEIFVYSYPEMKLLKRVSYPFFQNVHHVTRIGDEVVVVSTGLDLVVGLDKDSLEPVWYRHALGRDPWHRFSSDIDYRKVHSTKPHDSHPNYVFFMNEELWVTRFRQSDAVCLSDMNKRINIGAERIHDGHVMGDFVYFTAVDGMVVIANRHTLKVEERIDLNLIENQPCPLGWCRGLAIVDDLAYVGFSRIRETPIKENVLWALRLAGQKRALATRICIYNLRTSRKVGELTMPSNATQVIYSIIPARSV